MINTSQLTRVNEHVELKPIPPTKELPKWLPFKTWFRSKLMLLLDKLKLYDHRCNAQEISYSTITFDSDDIVKDVLKCMAAFDIRTQRPTVLLIGNDVWADLHQEKYAMRMVEFDTQFNIRTDYFNFLGLRVKVIPWMKGMVLLP